MDQQVRDNQFGYEANAVIQGERRERVDEHTGEPISLCGRIEMKEMGIYATRQQPLKIIEEQKKKQEEITKKRQTQANYIAPRQKTRIKLDKSRNVLNTDIDATILYKPKTKENRVQYEFILSTINQILLDSPPDVLRSVTDEVLAVLKSDDQKDKDKKQDLEGMLGPIKQELYDQLLNAAKMINDYHQSMEDNQLDDNDQRADIDQTFGLDEEEDEEDNFANNQDIQLIEQDKQDDDESEEEDQNGSQNNLEIKAKANMEMDAEDLNENNDLFYVDIRTIDPYWLQTKLNEAFKDPVQAQKLDKQVLQILHSENDINCENQLVMLLDYENFDLIKLLLKNRHKIYYCTLLGRAEDEQERQQVLDQMSKTEAGEKVLEQLRNIDKKVKQESNLRSKNNKANDIKQGKDIEQEDMQDYLTASKITDEEFNKLSKKILDLENLVFQQGSHFMSNEKCKPPDNTKKFSFKGYDEIYVPATKHTDIAEKKKISSLPKWAQLAFKDFEELNPIQTKVCDTALNSPENMLICAPTGAGKTNVALLTMLQVIGRYIKRDGTIDTSKFKIVYIAPMKALVSEMVLSFHKRLEKYGIVVKELTGDSQLSKEQIEETQLIIATPEKWDIVTRKSGDRTYTELVKLLIIDEIHLLHDSRGPVLESIVARTIRMIEQTQEMVRIVGLSATLPNYNDVATFIRVNVRSGLFYFDHTYRPIPLEQVYVGITEKKAVKRMMLMNEILYEKVVQRASSDKPMIIFVHSRRETVKTANYLREIAYSKDDLGKFLTEGSDSQTVLQSVAEKAQNKQLKEMLPFGFGIHHAGLNRADRNLVESLFFQRHLRVLVSTATLAWGVNLPAHTVIIKGTQIYSPEQGKWTELSPQDILQMIGRAGRPSFDRKGEGIILTTYTELKYYLSLLNQQLPIESQFLCQLPDQLNAEVVLGTISNVKDAVDWLGYTYLYIRMLRRPDLYSIPFEEFEEDRLLVRHRANLVHSAATLLDKYGLVKYDRKTGILQATSLGKIASHYYIKYPSMEIYNKHLKLNMGVVEIFKVFSLSNEFKFIPIREEEKGELQKLMDTVPIPIKGSPEDPAIKINILLQAYIGRLKLDGFALNSDMIYITQSAGRIVRAMFEICLKKGWANVAEIALTMCKMVDKRMWSCMTPLRQFKSIPEEILRRIEKKEQFNFEHLYNMNQQQLSDLVKVQQVGKLLHNKIHQFPRLELEPLVQPITRGCLKIDLNVKADFNWDKKVHGNSEPFWIFVTDCDGEELLYSEYFTMKSKFVEENRSYLFSFIVSLFENLHPIYYIKVISDRWIQSETTIPLSFKNLILPQQFSAPTKLLEFQLMPVNQLQFNEGEQALRALGIYQFNQIQTQVYNSFYNQNENIFLGAPTGSGKTTCIILAILRIFKGYFNEDKKIVYVGLQDSICQNMYKILCKAFKHMDKKIGILTGQTKTDNIILQKYDIIISTPENWDIMTRRWRGKKQIQSKNIRLFIADELHLLNENKSILEVIVSRMRLFSSQMDQNNKIQIIGLSTSVADYKEMASWIGAQQNNIFNFHPNVRPYPVDIHITGFEQNHRRARLLAMQKHMYQGLKQFLQNDTQQGIIFVCDRKQARLTALDLQTLATGDNKPKKFLKAPEQKIKEIAEQITDHVLADVVQYGIGFVYEGMLEDQRTLIENLYNAGALQIIISTYKLCWELNLYAQITVILDNQRYNGQERKYVDYTIPDMLQMISYAKNKEFVKNNNNNKNNNQENVNAKCLVFCHGPKKEFYKKFLFEPYPVESHLNQNLSNHLCGEIYAKNIKSIEDCIDWITWSFMYWRLSQNPNYYGLQEVSGTAVNDYLCELIEQSLEELGEFKCIQQEQENTELNLLNLGQIAGFYYIDVETIQLFGENIKQESKLKHLIEILSNAKEFEEIPIRYNEDSLLFNLNQKITFSYDKTNFNEPKTKTFILLQAYFSRLQVNSDLNYDQKLILENAVRLIHALVDVINSNGWSQQTIRAMKLCQMVVQGLWQNSSPLLQLPYFTAEIVDQLKEIGVQDIADFQNMDDGDREKILKQFSQEQVEEIATASNRYPSISIRYNIEDKDNIYSGSKVTVNVVLERDGEDYTEYVIAPYYPKQKEEIWWVLISDKKQNNLYSIKRLGFKSKAEIALEFDSPEVVGKTEFSIYLICDSYAGCDQVETFTLNIKENTNENGMNEE